MKVASFNVNSVRARLPNLLDWLQAAQPDVVLLQEIKVETDGFPAADFTAAGYHSLAHGQKTYNGVAILSRQPLTPVSTTLNADDPQARYLEAQLGDIRLINVYAPNGNPVDSDKFPYKLDWLKRLADRAAALLREEIPFLIGGDFNIIPEEIDCHDPAAWADDALFRPDSRAAWRTLCHLGLYDALRALHPAQTQAYTFWDYQGGSWPRDAGIRIDHVLLSPQLADRLTACHIDRGPRGADKASDHTPILVELAA